MHVLSFSVFLFFPLSLIITWSSQEALTLLQLILMRIRDNKQPINGGLKEEMEMGGRAEFSGWRRLITPLLQLCV